MKLTLLPLGIVLLAVPAARAAETSAPPAPPADAAVLRDTLTRVESELRNDILPFWLRHARDVRRGGFYGEISNELGVKEDAPRGALLTARILWTFSAAYERYRDPAYLEMARWASDDLWARFWDAEHGGLYWTATAAGAPLETRKVIYGQAFGVYALAEYNRATGDRTALERAIALYRLIEAHGHDPAHHGYYEEFSRDWKRLPNTKESFVSPAPKSQNTHLHVLEGYTNLLRVWPDPDLRANVRDLAVVMLDRILDPANHHLRLFLDDDWTPRSDGISFGHDIEFSWLLLETAEVLGDADLIARSKAEALAIARVTLAEGMDTDGGLLSEADPSGLTDTNKEWWQQAESVTGFFNAYQLSGDPRYLRASLATWNFITTHVVDHKYGEWYGMLARDGTVITPVKVSVWKCPYHDGRACMEMVERLRAVLGPDAGRPNH